MTNKDTTTTYLTKTGGETASLPQNRTEVWSNAGIKLLNVRVNDSAGYQSSVYFTEDDQIHNDAQLKVYPMKGEILINIYRYILC